jgi:hypothetical protein
LDLKKEGKAISTILAYKACIVKTIAQATGDTLLEGSTLTDFLKNLKSEVPKKSLQFPKWELCVVLRGLRLPPFEPLNEIEIKYLSFKTVFLVALASAARVSEISALSAEEGFISMKEDKSQVTLRPFAGFMAKNQTGEDPPREYVIKSLMHHIQGDDPERLLCPVRAIRVYLKRTNKFREDKKKLFISLNPKYKRELGVNTISRWIREAIKLAYQMQGSADIEKLYSISAHEVRAISTSLLAWKNTAIKEILKAAYWKCHNTFTQYYLRNMTLASKRLHRQGSGVISAGKELVLDI